VAPPPVQAEPKPPAQPKEDRILQRGLEILKQKGTVAQKKAA